MQQVAAIRNGSPPRIGHSRSRRERSVTRTGDRLVPSVASMSCLRWCMPRRFALDIPWRVPSWQTSTLLPSCRPVNTSPLPGTASSPWGPPRSGCASSRCPLQGLRRPRVEEVIAAGGEHDHKDDGYPGAPAPHRCHARSKPHRHLRWLALQRISAVRLTDAPDLCGVLATVGEEPESVHATRCGADRVPECGRTDSAVPASRSMGGRYRS